MTIVILLLGCLEIWLLYELIAAWRSGVFSTRFQMLDSHHKHFFRFTGPRLVTSKEKEPGQYWARMIVRVVFIGFIVVCMINIARLSG